MVRIPAGQKLFNCEATAEFGPDRQRRPRRARMPRHVIVRPVLIPVDTASRSLYFPSTLISYLGKYGEHG
jgi:hypothetical protein